MKTIHKERTLYIQKCVENKTNPDAEVVYVWCPSCVKDHTHGFSKGYAEALPTYREAHCTKYGASGYWIDFYPN